MVIASNFGQFQTMILMINIIILATLQRWYLTIGMVLIGLYTSFNIYTYMYDDFDINLGSLQLKIMYLSLLMGGVLVAFFKPKEDKEILREEKIRHHEHILEYKNYELADAIAAKNNVFTNMEHELRTPVLGITGIGEALYANYDRLNDEERKLALKQISLNSTRLSSLINNMIDLSKLVNGNTKLKLEKLNFMDLINDRVEVSIRVYDVDEEKHQFDCHLDPDIELLADKNYLVNTIDNLLINAIKYSPHGGKIVITTSIEEDNVLFTISDEGIGIPKEELKPIFGMFVVSSKTKTIAGGRGIGLSLCQKVIELHGGQIWAENSPTGKGSVFKFTLPKKED
jgi:signal transduction histidine kinase